MLDLNDFRYFVRIAECGGITAASRNLNVPKSTVSHRLQQLETSLGVRLVNRTSRSLSMTDAGDLFYRHAVAMLERADLAESAVRERLMEPSGTIRFTTAVATSLFALRPMLSDFIRRHPKVNVILHTSDDQVDIVGGSYDLAVRAHTGPLSDSTLVQRILAPAPWFLFAGPAYLERRGVPFTPEDLAGHDTLIMCWRPGFPIAWKLQSPDARRSRRTDRVRGLPAMTWSCSSKPRRMVSGSWLFPAMSAAKTSTQARSGGSPLPEWLAGEARITAVIPFRHGLLPSSPRLPRFSGRGISQDRRT